MRFKDTLGLSFFLKNLQNETQKKLDKELKPLHLTSAQYSVLSVIEEVSPLTGAELSRRCYVSPQTMSRILQDLAKQQFVTKSSSPGHELKQDYTSTKKAMNTLCDAHVLVNEIELKMVRGFSKKEVTLLQTYLRRCFENLRREE